MNGRSIKAKHKTFKTMATKKSCNEQAIQMIVNPALDELEQLRQTTIIATTCDALLPEQRTAATDVARVLYPHAFNGEKGEEFTHNGETYQATISRKYKYPKKSRNPLIDAQLRQLHFYEERMSELNNEKKQLTKEMAVLKGKLNPKMKLESETFSVSVKSK